MPSSRPAPMCPDVIRHVGRRRVARIYLFSLGLCGMGVVHDMFNMPSLVAAANRTTPPETPRSSGAIDRAARGKSPRHGLALPRSLRQHHRAVGRSQQSLPSEPHHGDCPSQLFYPRPIFNAETDLERGTEQGRGAGAPMQTRHAHRQTQHPGAAGTRASR